MFLIYKGENRVGFTTGKRYNVCVLSDEKKILVMDQHSSATRMYENMNAFREDWSACELTNERHYDALF